MTDRPPRKPFVPTPYPGEAHTRTPADDDPGHDTDPLPSGLVKAVRVANEAAREAHIREWIRAVAPDPELTIKWFAYLYLVLHGVFGWFPQQVRVVEIDRDDAQHDTEEDPKP